MKKVMVTSVVALLMAFSTLFGGGPEVPEFVGNTPSAQNALEMGAVSNGAYRMKRTNSERLIATKLFEELEKMREDEKEHQEQLLQKQESLNSRPANKIASSLTSSTESSSVNNANSELRINSMDIVAKVIRTREKVEENIDLSKKTNETVISIFTHLTALEKKVEQMQSTSMGAKVLATGKVICALFVTVGIGALLAASY